MAIQVTCPGCHVRFTVSEKFAGREGPCPKCKAVIQIPEKSQEVVIHEPETGPRDAKGQSVTKPLARRETRLSGVHWTMIIGTIVFSLVVAFFLRLLFAGEVPTAIVAICGFLLAVPCVFAAYTFLRDQELGAFYGRELWLRVGVVALVYSVLWILMVVARVALLNWSPVTWMTGGVAMLLAGGVVAMLALELDYLTGILHVGMYFVVSMICRLIAGIGILPGWMEWSQSIQQQNLPQEEGTIELISHWTSLAFESLASCYCFMG